MARVLVTGGLGFIGSHLVDALLQRGDEPVIIDSCEPQVHGAHRLAVSGPPGVELHRQSANGTCLDVLFRCDKVVHLAAVVGVGQSMYQPSRYVACNTLATAAFMDAVCSAQPQKLVVASSMSIYGEGDYVCTDHGHLRFTPRARALADLGAKIWDPLCLLCKRPLQPTGTRENSALRPTSVYAITKQDQEQLCLVLGGAYGIPTTALRFFNVYGSGQALSNPYTGVCAIFAARLLNGERPQVFEDGKQTRDFIHVSDVVRGILAALDDETGKSAGESINLGTGKPTEVWTIAGQLAHEFAPRTLGQVDGKVIAPEFMHSYRAGDVRHCYADVSKARKLLGWEAKVEFSAGLKTLAEYLREQAIPLIRGDSLAELRVNGLVT